MRIETNAMLQRLIMFGIGISAGLLLWFAFPKTNHVLVSETRVVVKEVVKTKTVSKWRDRTVTVTEPGKTTVIVEKEQSKEDSASTTVSTTADVSKKETKPVLSRYSILAGASVNTRKEVQYTLGAEARLGDTPLWLGISGSGPIPTVSFHVRMELQ